MTARLGQQPTAAVLVLSLAFVTGPSVQAGPSVAPGGEILSMAADPVRTDRLYVLTDANELVVIDVDSASVVRRAALPRQSLGGLAVEDDGSHVWVGLAFPTSVVAQDLTTGEFGDPIVLPADYAVSDMEIGRPGRLYASVDRDGMAIVDTDAGILVAMAPLPGTESDLVLRSDRRVLYALGTSGSNAELLALDVTTDSPLLVGFQCCALCSSTNGGQLALAPDDETIYTASGFPYHVQVLSGTSLFHPQGSLLTGTYPNAVAVSEDGSRVYVGHSTASLLIVDAVTRLPLHREPVGGRIGDGGLLVGPGEAWLAVARGDGGLAPVAVEFLAPDTLGRQTVGAVCLRPIDPVTREPVLAWLDGDSGIAGTTRDWRDLDAGQVAWGPAPPGDYELVLESNGMYEELSLTARVEAGRWTDLGDVVLTRARGDHWAPAGACVTPPLVSGLRMDVEIHGMNYVDGPGLGVSLGPDVTVHSWEWLRWSTIRASVTAAPGIAQGSHSREVVVTNPDGAAEDGGSFIVAAWPDYEAGLDRALPAEVEFLSVKKRTDGQPGLLFEWTEVTTQVDGTPETLGDYQLRKGVLANHSDGWPWMTTAQLSINWIPPPDDSLPDFVTFTVRARDAMGNVGK